MYKDPGQIRLYPQVTCGTDVTEGWQTSPPIVGLSTEPLVQQPLSSISVKLREAEQKKVQDFSDHASPWSTVAETLLFTQPLHRMSIATMR